jgi:acyl phosphate:glycerol-3-phosphate acyltransferase
MFSFFFCLLLAYLLGSIPTSVWVGKAWFKLDIRDHGSGNAGATNTFRVLGRKAGIFVMLVDVLKGLVATTLAWYLLNLGIIEREQMALWRLLLGIMAIVGHVFPVFAQFRGGKGVATLAGMMLGVQYEVALICIAVFIIVLIISNFVSLSSIIASLAFPLLVLWVPGFQQETPVLVIFGFLLFIGVTITHRNNIRRILKGEENKTYLIKR